MGIRAEYQIDEEQVSDMDLTISITMKIREWHNFMRSIPRDGFESHHMGRVICGALGDVTRASKNKYTYPPV
jgi:hypothetical protein